MNLPKLLDGDKYYGDYFLRLALLTMETCIKEKITDNLLQPPVTLLKLDNSLRLAWLVSLIIILYKVGKWNFSCYPPSMMGYIKTQLFTGKILRR